MEISASLMLNINGNKIEIPEDHPDWATWAAFKAMCQRRNAASASQDDPPPPDAEKSKTTKSSGDALARNPQPGERTVDYARRVAKTFPGTFRLKELTAKMEELGWSSDAADKINAVGTTLRKNEDFRHIGEGNYEYVGNDAAERMEEQQNGSTSNGNHVEQSLLIQP